MLALSLDSCSSELTLLLILGGLLWHILLSRGERFALCQKLNLGRIVVDRFAEATNVRLEVIHALEDPFPRLIRLRLSSILLVLALVVLVTVLSRLALTVLGLAMEIITMLYCGMKCNL